MGSKSDPKGSRPKLRVESPNPKEGSLHPKGSSVAERRLPGSSNLEAVTPGKWDVFLAEEAQAAEALREP